MNFLTGYSDADKEDNLSDEYIRVSKCLSQTVFNERGMLERAALKFVVEKDAQGAKESLYDAMIEGNRSAASIYYNWTADGCFFYYQEIKPDIPIQDFCPRPIKQKPLEMLQKQLSKPKRGHIKHTGNFPYIPDYVKSCLLNNYSDRCIHFHPSLALFKDENVGKAEVRVQVTDKEESVHYKLNNENRTKFLEGYSDENGYATFTYDRGDKFYTYWSPGKFADFTVVEINLNSLPRPFNSRD